MREPEPFKLVTFDSNDDRLTQLRESAQGQYLRWYLADLHARSVLIEPAYFEPNMRAFCHVAYHPALPPLVAHACSLLRTDWGVSIAAF